MNLDSIDLITVFGLTYGAAALSLDPSTQNGALLLNPEGKIIGLGYNDFPNGVSLEHWNGPKEGKYARVVHAEVSAILDAARAGHSTVGSVLVCPWAACSNCSKHIAEAGVAVLVRHPNNDADTGNHWHADCEIGDEIMREAGVKIVEHPVVETSIVLRRNGQDWPSRG